MQLTANFVVLATALAYSSSSVLALPVDSSYAARDVEYDLEAREVGPSDMLEYSTRELYDMYLEARGYYDEGLDARDYHDIEMEAREYVEDLEARAVEVCLFILLTNGQTLTWFIFLFVAPRYTSDPNYSRYPGYPSDACYPGDTRVARFRLFVFKVHHPFHYFVFKVNHPFHFYDHR